jgi:hypothetical protein
MKHAKNTLQKSVLAIFAAIYMLGTFSCSEEFISTTEQSTLLLKLRERLKTEDIYIRQTIGTSSGNTLRIEVQNSPLLKDSCNNITFIGSMIPLIADSCLNIQQINYEIVIEDPNKPDIEYASVYSPQEVMFAKKTLENVRLFCENYNTGSIEKCVPLLGKTFRSTIPDDSIIVSVKMLKEAEGHKTFKHILGFSIDNSGIEVAVISDNVRYKCSAIRFYCIFSDQHLISGMEDISL